MIKRTLFISSPCYLNCKNKQLIITNNDTGEINQTPVEDVGYVVFDNPSITISQYLLQELSENNVGVILCNNKHFPSSMLLHLDTNQIQTEIFSFQINAKEPLKKQLWQQTVKAKIKNQSRVLKKLKKNADPLVYLSKNVKSGDSSNQESRAARYYWKEIFGKEFRRNRYGQPPNNALSYGYTIIRAAVARALSGSGLLPTLGIHHKNRYNSFCLADDIMEPYRPYVDLVVYKNLNTIIEENSISKEIIAELLKILSSDVVIENRKSPLMIALTRTSSSLAKCISGDSKSVIYPVVE